MEFDFYKEYARLSNADLLRIILLQHQYQPAAVAVAEELLAQRNITEEDQRLAAESIAPKRRTILRDEVVPAPNGDWQPGDDIFAEPAIESKYTIVKRSWRIIATALAIAILNFIWLEVRVDTRGYYSGRLLSDSDAWVNMFITVLQIAGYVLYWRKKRLGWILTTAWICYMCFASLLSLVVLMYYSFSGQAVKTFMQLILLVTSLFLLLLPDMRNLYRIDKGTKLRTIILSLGFGILYASFAVVWTYYRVRNY